MENMQNMRDESWIAGTSAKAVRRTRETHRTHRCSYLSAFSKSNHQSLFVSKQGYGGDYNDALSRRLLVWPAWPCGLWENVWPSWPWYCLVDYLFATRPRPTQRHWHFGVAFKQGTDLPVATIPCRAYQ